MIKFVAPQPNGQSAEIDLSVAHLFGNDGVPLRAEFDHRDDTIVCKKRTAGPAGLSLMWPVQGAGRLMVDTVRLQEREEPFVLTLELARGYLMHMVHKCEDWGLFDCPDATELNKRMSLVGDKLIEALKAESYQSACALGQETLNDAVTLAEDMTAYHAQVLLERRLHMAGFSRYVFGCHLDHAGYDPAHVRRIGENFDFAVVPVPWKRIEPGEQTYDWTLLDKQINALAKQRLPIKCAPLVCFQESCIPDWLFIWEHDFETVRDVVAEHIRKIVTRYRNRVQAWDVISGIHANDVFSLNFEQIIELTRVAANVTKQVAPKALAIIDIVAPWGEYYARNQRTIPPMLYAEMAVQSGINFDAFGLQFCLAAHQGMYARDLFQISAVLDRFGAFGKPLHVTAVQVPSAPVESVGWWHGGWNEQTQAEWLPKFYTIALSKPFVETVSWKTLSDAKGQPGFGLLRADDTPKPAFERLARLRQDILPNDTAADAIS